MPEGTPITGTQTIHPNNEVTQTPQITYTKEEETYIAFRRQRMISAQVTRDSRKQEWDNMTFLEYYDVLKKADDQYVAPRKNEQDTAINLGTIRDKDTSLVEFANSNDFEPIAQVFDDEDDMLEEMAETGEDLVRKSLLMEDFKSKAKLIYRSMIAFGTAMVEDTYVERWVMEKTLKQGFKAGMGSDQASWETKMVKQYDGCQAKLWDLRKIYFGDIRKFFLNGPQGQPFMFTVEYESYDVVKTIFGAWDRFIYVPTEVVTTGELSNSSFSASWTLRPVSGNFVEVVKYYDPVANEFGLTLNGIDMLPLMKKETTQGGVTKVLVSGFPLTEVSPSGAINFAKYDFEPMHDFAYSKAQPGKMRVAAAVENMMVKAFIGMFKQKWKPTMGNKSGRQFDSSVTDPAQVINDIRDGDLFPVLPNYQGAQPADYSFFEIMKKELDKNSVERSWQGMDNTSGAGPQPQDDTATKSMNDMKAQSLKVASMMDGIISGHSQLFWLRTYNIMKNWTKPIDNKVDGERKQLVSIYRTVTVPTTIDGGQKATKKIMFTKDTPKLADGKKRASLDDSFDIQKMEQDHQDEYGGEIRIVKLHPEIWAILKQNWFYKCVPVPNGNDPLSYMMFAKQIQDATAMFGPDSLNVKKLKHMFAARTGQDFDTWFISEEELQQKQQQAQAAAAAGGATGAAGGSSVPAKPTIAGAAAGKMPGQMAGALMK